MTKLDFDAADLNLIARCHRAKEAIPQIARGAQIMFWIMFVGVALFTGVVIWMYATKGTGGVPPGAQAYLGHGLALYFRGVPRLPQPAIRGPGGATDLQDDGRVKSGTMAATLTEIGVVPAGSRQVRQGARRLVHNGPGTSHGGAEFVGYVPVAEVHSQIVQV